MTWCVPHRRNFVYAVLMGFPIGFTCAIHKTSESVDERTILDRDVYNILLSLNGML